VLERRQGGLRFPGCVVRAVAEDLRLLGRELGIRQHAVIAKIRQLLQTLKRVGKSHARLRLQRRPLRRSGLSAISRLRSPFRRLTSACSPDAFAHMIAAIVSVLLKAAV
jgi:hypothetical protein